MSELKVNNSAIKLRESNPYRNGELNIFTNGDIELVRFISEWKGSVDDKYYTVRNTDFLDKIAWHFYKDLIPNAEGYWWVIADANTIENPMDLSEYIGSQIVIPDILLFKLINK